VLRVDCDRGGDGDGGAARVQRHSQEAPPRRARERAVGTRITVSSDLRGDCYVLHTGDAGECQCNGETPATCDAGAHAIKSVFFPAAGPVRLATEEPSTGIAPVRGNAISMNTFTLTDEQGREVRHVISTLGRVRSCATSPSLSRYAPC
jgi:type IV fimbrial biogenesis protein FimT